ncbi:ABC transporter ATP-binding protein [Clostridium beijerinckii]|uniref:ABC transporter ATP-binding protein n=1 Tax=Clostridium beijerinckii TaxID=1520 RepID=UPI00098CC751|nr:ABC transporter ATP-binding protein [Clostridium beijerinckii]MBA8936322.1 ABC-2 type transport system ATP-binding protein [Clostridium beijerinckii]NRT32153.1 ABC-2 type transport system ATP-binding protein [Clostridium beijerinckii]NRT48419.1 ABC-2 type transport system ATP-binding protein [Clostridium beijerinckii]NRU36394.1 ABC-2 type transport system ATP-binding protein [Clostridium beijerinckii]NRZ23283.1 ABC-2 type transport system ATP-binding protein [Clostridium beijerinckii]
MENVISMKRVRKEFNKNVALQNLSFSVKKGEIFGFLGPNGAGKTTAIKILTSQLIPTSGEVLVLDKNLYVEKFNEFRDIGILSDNNGLYERLTVKDNLMLLAEINKVNEKDIDYVLECMNMLKYKNIVIKKLSKGMKQRVMLMQAVLHRPKLLFLDEPTSSLDPGTVLEIHKFLRKINHEGTTIFLTTHNMEEADKLCDRVAFLNNGEIVETGKPEELKLKYASDEIKIKLKDEDKLITVKNNKEGAENIQSWMKNGRVLSIHSSEPSLEEIFLHLTGREL